MAKIQALQFENGMLRLIDQRKLPVEAVDFICRDYREVEFAIRDMVVRGAPAIGATAAYGAVLAAMEFQTQEGPQFHQKMHEALDVLNRSRPTAVNLMWAVARMRKILIGNEDNTPVQISELMKSEADRIYRDDVDTCKQMGEHGNGIVPQGAVILTHCNTGSLATAGYGTALGVVKEAHYQGKDIFVYADETRPRLQGARLTAWELVQEKIPAKLIPDSVAATLIRDGKIDLILVGADRIARNGDTANKIGTFMLSVLARTYNVPFYVVAPVSTIDPETPDGSGIDIEERDAEEVTRIDGVQIAPEGMDVFNPAFDVTPHENITGIITEKGILKAPFEGKIVELTRDND